MSPTCTIAELIMTRIWEVVADLKMVLLFVKVCILDLHELISNFHCIWEIAVMTQYSNCSTGSVRLADKTLTDTTAEGRVEVCINQAWGTVCNKRFDNDDAGTVCFLAGGYLRNGTF